MKRERRGQRAAPWHTLQKQPTWGAPRQALASPAPILVLPTNMKLRLKNRLVAKPHPFLLFFRNPRADLLQNGLVGSPCSPRDSQESSPTPQFKSICSLVLRFLHSPTLTFTHDHWKNHSLDQTDLCWQSMSLLLNMLSRLVITFLPRSKASFNFMAEITLLLIYFLNSPKNVSPRRAGFSLSYSPLYSGMA